MKKSELIRQLNLIECDYEVYVVADHSQEAEIVSDVCEHSLDCDGVLVHPDDVDGRDLYSCIVIWGD